MKIGITFRDDLALNQAWFGSGIAQNLKFYYDLFALLGHSPFWLTHHAFSIEHGGNTYVSRTRQQLLEEGTQVDLIIEAGATISAQEQHQMRTATGCKIVGLRCGHQYAIYAEGLFVTHDLSKNLVNRGQDIMWLLPHYADQSEWLSVVHGCETVAVPYVWEPDFIQGTFAQARVPAQPNIVVMEPNINVTKTAMIPLAAIQNLYQTAPDSFARAEIYNADHFSSKDYFLHNFVTCLPVLQANKGKVYFHGRRPFTQIFDHPHVLLSHQFHNPLNYLYNEALYMGIPLVHNSPEYQSVGYYYPDFDAVRAAQQLAAAIKGHSPAHAANQGQAFLHRYSIHNNAVQQAYQRLLHQALTT